MDDREALYIRFVLSTKSGKGMEKNLPQKIREIFARAEAEKGIRHKGVDIRMTEYAGHGAELARDWAARYGAEGVVYIGGGDGSVNEAANALAGSGCAMGVLPLGTGNDFARQLYPGLKAKEALRRVLPRTPEAELTAIDLLEVNGHYCVNVLSLGYDTVVLKTAYDILEKHPFLGQMAYVLAVLKTIFYVKHYPLHFEMKDEKGEIFSADKIAATAVVGNGGYYGSGFNPSPEADLQDGLGDFLYADNLSFKEFLPLAFQYKKGEHLGHPKIHMMHMTEGLIRSSDGRPIPANYDGEIFQSSEIRLKMHPGKLRFAKLMPFKNEK